MTPSTIALILTTIWALFWLYMTYRVEKASDLIMYLFQNVNRGVSYREPIKIPTLSKMVWSFKPIKLESFYTAEQIKIIQNQTP
jgi:energy-converting hydrogenase Eha subunit G